MNFRRKKSAKKAAGKKSGQSSSASSVRESSTEEEAVRPNELLPVLNNRFSMILPHLSEKFPILTAEDAASLDEIESLANPSIRQAAAISTSESGPSPFQQPPPLVPSPSLRRLDVDNESDTETRYFPSNHSSLSSPFPTHLNNSGSLQSAGSLNPAPDPLSPIITSANYRRFNGSGNSLFGGRVMSKTEIKMSMSASSTSLNSQLGKSPVVKEDKHDYSPKENNRSGAAEKDLDASNAERATESSRALEVARKEVIGTTNRESEPVDPILARALSQLDDDELSDTEVISSLFKTQIMGRNSDQDENGSTYSQLSPHAPVFSFTSPSQSNPVSNPSTESRMETPATSSASATDLTIDSAKSNLDIPIPRDITPSQPFESAPSPTTASVPFSASPLFHQDYLSPLAPVFSIDSSSTRDGGHSPSLTASTSEAFSLDTEVMTEDLTSLVPAQTQQPDVSDEGPFDLSYNISPRRSVSHPTSADTTTVDNISPSRRSHISTAGSTAEPVTMRERASFSSMGSSGSSYHSVIVPMNEESSVERLSLYDPPSLMERLQTGGVMRVVQENPVEESVGESEDSYHSESTRGKSGRDIGAINGGIGEEDLALEDLLLIQQTLVRSASRKAAKKLGSSRASLSGSDVTHSRSDTSRDKSLTPDSYLMMNNHSNQLNQQQDQLQHQQIIFDGASNHGDSISFDQESHHIVETTLRDTLDTPFLLSSNHSTSMTPQTSQNSIETSESRLTSSSVGDDAFEWSSGLISPVDGPYQNPLETSEYDINRFLEEEEAEDHLINDPAIQAEATTPTLRSSTGVRRDPTHRMSTVVREVRNQANAATISLKKQESNSTFGRLRKMKSVKSMNISSPVFISGPDIPAGEISNIDHSPGRDTSGSNYSNGGGGGKNASIGLRFKKLLSKSTKEHSQAQTSELSPLTPPPSAPSPSTPPAPDINQFATTPDNQRISDFTSPPTNGHYRSPGLTRVPETGSDKGSGSSTISAEPSRSISRLVSKLRRPSDNVEARSNIPADLRGSISNPIPTSTSPSLASQRMPSFESMQSDGSSKAPVNYDVAAARRRRDLDYSNMPATAPLSLNKSTSDNPAFDSPELRANSPSSAPLSNSRNRREKGIAEDRILEESMDQFLGVAQDPVAGVPLFQKAVQRKPVFPNRVVPPPVPSISAAYDYSNTTNTAPFPTIHPNQQRAITPDDQNDASKPPDSHQALLRALDNGSRLATPTLPLLNTTDIDSLPQSSQLSFPSPTNLRIPRTQSEHHSVSARPNSGYAGSVFDLYGGDDEDDDESRSISNSMLSKVNRARESTFFAGGPIDIGEEEERQGFTTQSYENGSDYESREGGGEGEGTAEDRDQDNLWRAMGDLRSGDRDSILFAATDARRFSNHSRRSSADSATAPCSDPFSALVSRHRRDQALHPIASSVNKGDQQRDLSVYARDERRLALLEGGVADYDMGRFLVRTRMAEEDSGDKGGVDGWKRETGIVENNMI